MARVIQDSDDEEETFEAEEELMSNQIRNASNPTTQEKDPTQAGTGSTESLRNAFQEAHRGLFQTEDDSPPFNAAREQALEPPQDLISTGAPRLLTESPSHQFHGQPPEPFAPPGANVAQPEGWDLEGTIRENYAAHEPMAMFPDPSSTVSNTTATQERLMQEVMAPEFLGLQLYPEIVSEPEPYVSPYKPASSVPWSDFLKTQPDEPSCGPGNSSQRAILEPPDSERPEMERLSQCSRDSTPDPVSECVLEGVAGTMPPPPLPSDLPTDLDHGTQEKPIEVNGTQETPLCPPSSDRAMAQKAISSPPSKRKRKSSQITSDDYLEDIGLPKEQYKPRPSRSRSSRAAVEEPMDYSRIPEKTVRKRTRRGKTPSETNNADELSTPKKIQQICAMGFTPTSTQKALEQNQGNVSQSIDWLIAKGAADDEDELAPRRTSPRKEKSKKNNTKTETPAQNLEHDKVAIDSSQKEVIDGPRSSAVTNNTAHAPAVGETPIPCDPPIESMPPPVQQRTPAKVSVVIPRLEETTPRRPTESPSKPEEPPAVDPVVVAPSKKGKRRKSEPKPPQLEDTNPDDAPVPAQKKARGRPKKNTTASLASVPPEAPAGADIPDERVESEKSPIKPTHEAENSNKQAPPPPTEELSEDPTATPPPKAKINPTESVQTPETQVKPPNGKTPIPSSAKTPYRVGLSRRHRIAPLLKIVKK